MEIAGITIDAGNEEEAVLRAVHMLRGAIITSFSHVEFQLVDLYFRATRRPEYSGVAVKFPYTLESRIKYLNKLADLPGPLNNYRDEIRSVSGGLLQFEKIRHFLAHGMLVYYFDPAAQLPISFRMYNKVGENVQLEEVTTNLPSLEQKCREVQDYSEKFIMLAARICTEIPLPQLG